METTAKHQPDPNLPPAADDREHVVRIQPSRGWVRIDFHELWRYRELFYFLTWRDIKVRYKQTVLGASWAILQPLLTMVVFSVFFGRMAGIDSDGVPYPIFSFCGLVPWVFFANALTAAANSLVASSRLIKKVYFPRLIIPVSSVLAGLLDFLLAFLMLLVLMGFYGLAPSMRMLWIPVYTLIAIVSALGVGLILSAINVQFRDVRYTLPFLVQIWMFASPVIYPSKYLTENWRILYSLNPMVGVLDGFRWAMLGTDTAPGVTLWTGLLSSATLLIFGLIYFRRLEKTFADVV